MIGIRNMIEAKNIMECIIETINMPFFLPKNKQSHFVTISLPQIVNNRQIIGIRGTFILNTIKQILKRYIFLKVEASQAHVSSSGRRPDSQVV
jgi:hypothetical protein